MPRIIHRLAAAGGLLSSLAGLLPDCGSRAGSPSAESCRRQGGPVCPGRRAASCRRSPDIGWSATVRAAVAAASCNGGGGGTPRPASAGKIDSIAVQRAGAGPGGQDRRRREGSTQRGSEERSRRKARRHGHAGRAAADFAARAHVIEVVPGDTARHGCSGGGGGVRPGRWRGTTASKQMQLALNTLLSLVLLYRNLVLASTSS